MAISGISIEVGVTLECPFDAEFKGSQGKEFSCLLGAGFNGALYWGCMHFSSVLEGRHFL